MPARLAGGASSDEGAPARIIPLERPSPEEIRRFRAALGLTRLALARQLGVTPRAVEHWETGRREPPPFLRLAFTALDRRLELWTA